MVLIINVGADPVEVIDVAEAQVAQYLLDGWFPAYEYASIGDGDEDVTLQLVPRRTLASWTVAAGAPPPSIDGLTDAQLIMLYLRTLGRTAYNWIEVGSMSPNSDVPAGGEEITIGGHGFMSGHPGTLRVLFDGVESPIVEVVSDTELTAIAPAHVAAVDLYVTVITAYGSHSLLGFFYAE